MKNKLIENIKKSEGFVGIVYKDTLQIDTIGYGTKLPLSKFEAELILKHRLDGKIKELLQNKPFVEILSENVQNALFEMAYQLGVSGLLKFKKMWIALEKEDYHKAHLEALDSLWAKQTPSRAKRIANIIKLG